MKSYNYEESIILEDYIDLYIKEQFEDCTKREKKVYYLTNIPQKSE